MLLVWSEISDMWYRYTPAPTYNTRKNLESWAKKNLKNGTLHLVVPDDPTFLRSLESEVYGEEHNCNAIFVG